VPTDIPGAVNRLIATNKLTKTYGFAPNRFEPDFVKNSRQRTLNDWNTAFWPPLRGR